MMAIFKGDIPASVSLGSIIKEIPLDWEAQRKTLGFSQEKTRTGTRKISV